MCRKLDLSGVRVYTNTKADVRDAIDSVGGRVYLSDDVTFESYKEAELAEVNYTNSTAYPFFGGNGEGCFKYIIRAEDVKFKKEEKEKILRPFKDVNEFRTTIGCAIGNVITYKKKNNDAEYTVLFNGYVRLNDNVLGIYLGRRSYTLKELKDDYLYLRVNEWKPFGVEEINKTNKPLDLENVKVYTKEDAVEAISLIGQDVYVSNDKDFEVYHKYRLVGVQVMEYNIPPFLGDNGSDIEAYKYFILEKDAKFKENTSTSGD